MNLYLDSLGLLEPEGVAGCIASLVEALAQVNMLYLKKNPGTPRLYLSRVKYQETTGWCDIPHLLETKRGDCKSLVAWRIAELRNLGKNAFVHVVYTQLPDKELYHVKICKGPSIFEDPSEMLGMKSQLSV